MNAPRTIEPRPPRMTAEEFVAWAVEQPGRYELIHGEVVPMPSEMVVHVEVKFEAAIALRQAVKAAGLDCQALCDGMAVRVGAGSVYEPDACVRCGSRLPPDTLLLTDPVIVVEVLSPSTGWVDTGRKLKGYFTLPSVRHYLILDPEDLTLVHHRRADAGRIETRILPARPEDGGASPELLLDPPGLRLAVADLFGAS